MKIKLDENIPVRLIVPRSPAGVERIPGIAPLICPG